MKTETKNRIKAYQKALPHMKERVLAVAMLLVISVTMMTSATFAWITLSRSPEVTGLATTLVANGNLEIALSDIDGEEPEDSQVGDGGKTVRLSNLTWGNLVNLSDASYGLDAVTLRPAMLNTDDLRTAPLYAVTYGADGRVTGTTSNFRFTNYDTIDGISAFYVPKDGNTDYGVRAISSVSITTKGQEQLVDQMDKRVTRSLISARTSFQSLYNNEAYMSKLTSLADIYLNYRMADPDKDQDCGAYVPTLNAILIELHEVMGEIQTNVLDVINLRHYMYCNQHGQSYVAFEAEDLVDGTARAALKAECEGELPADATAAQKAEAVAQDKFVIALDAYLQMYNKFYGANENGAYYQLKAIFDEYNLKRDYVGWEELAGVGSRGGPLNAIADIPSTRVGKLQASQIGASNIGQAIDREGNEYLSCIVTNGLIKDVDQYLGTMLNVKVAQIKALIPVEKVQITTNADSSNVLSQANVAAHEAASGELVATEETAADTYGMAIDFWVRTNSKNSSLILEGEYITDEVEKTDAAGNLILDDDGKPILENKVIAYGGVNRVWEGDDPGLPNNQGIGTSATQGTGSCYIYYIENPEDQRQSLEVLKAMTVAFVDEEGVLMATAYMDTENVFEDGGRVLVPLQINGRTIVTGQKEKTDEDGNIIYQKDENGDRILDGESNPIPEMENIETVSYDITQLTQNEAKRITAILYLDGNKLSNSQVLSAGAIMGQLNIQFGTTEDLVSMNDPDLKKEWYSLSASVQPVSGDFTKYDPNNKPVVDVTLTLSGMEANMVRANFISMLSPTQGAKQEPFIFSHTAGTATWTARVTLNGAGTYQLRSVQIDGVDYPLTVSEENQIIIPGTTVSNLQVPLWGEGVNKGFYRGSDNFYNIEMTVDISGTTPRKVQGVFENADRQNVTVNFSYASGTQWVGEGTFVTSGEYDMTYMIIDGVRVPLNGTDYKHLELQLGLRTQIYITQPVNAEYKELSALHSTLEEMADQAAARAAEDLTDEQKTLAVEVITGSEDITSEEKTALTEAVNGDALTSDQLTSLMALVSAKMEAVLDTLYNGDPNDPDDGMQLKSSAGGYSFFFNGGRGNELYMDVSCIIVDDKDHPITGLTGVRLEYKQGSSDTNGLDEDMRWNSDTSCYECEFELATLGHYSFRKLKIGSDEITVATSAPIIAANSRDPMKYVGPSDDNVASDLVIRQNAQRKMAVALENAPAARVKFTLFNSDNGATFESLVDAPSYSDDEKKQYEYTVFAPTDGNWKIVGLKVADVVYTVNNRKTYFDGSTDSAWVDLSELVDADNIATEFRTTVYYEINKAPQEFYYDDVEFMESNEVTGMTVKLFDYLGRPVEGADVTLKYEWNSVTGADYFDVSSSVTYPNTKFEATQSAEDLTLYEMPDMNFQMPGQYGVKFEIKIGNDTYGLDKLTKGKNHSDSVAIKPVNVQWTLPELKITAVTSATKDSVTNTTFGVNVNGNLLQGVQNYFEDYYANVYISGKASEYACPSVTLKLFRGYGAATSATVAVKNNENSGQNRTYTFTANEASDTQPIGHSTTGALGLGTGFGASRYPAGKQTVNRVSMKYGDITYSVKLYNDKAITIDQQLSPLYLTLNVDTTNVDMPATIEGISSSGKTFTASTGGSGNPSIVSPDGRSFKVKLPAITKSHNWDQVVWDEANTVYSDPVPTTTKGYLITKEYGGCDDGKYDYAEYVLNTRTATANGVHRYYTDTYTVTGWSLNAVDGVLTVSSTATVTATITKTTLEHTDEAETVPGTTRTQHLYVATGTTYTKTSGYSPTITADQTTAWYDAPQ